MDCGNSRTPGRGQDSSASAMCHTTKHDMTKQQPPARDRAEGGDPKTHINCQASTRSRQWLWRHHKTCTDAARPSMRTGGVYPPGFGLVYDGWACILLYSRVLIRPRPWPDGTCIGVCEQVVSVAVAALSSVGVNLLLSPPPHCPCGARCC